LGSVLNNFITAFFGSLTKTCVDGRIVWTLPCDLQAGLACDPRQIDPTTGVQEGIACYFLRLMANGFSGTKQVVQDLTYNGSTTLFVTVVTETYCGGLLVSVSAPTVIPIVL
jgi:hypothetical protein